MKNIFKLFILTTLLQTYPCYSTMTTGTILQEIITNENTTRNRIYTISDSQNYTTGGITFTYPVGLFTLPPIVQVAIQPNAPHPTTETFGAEINANSASSTTIMIYLVNGGVVSEAPNGSVLVSLFAIEDPV